MAKKKIVFDITDASTIEDSDSIGAFLRSADGTLLTHTTVGSDQALDVAVKAFDATVTVTATDLDIRDLSAAQDSVAISDGTDTLAIEADGSINVNATLADKPVQFRLDGLITEVSKDTVTPANSRPLPVELTGASGPINITAGDLNVQLSHSGANPDSTRIGDGVDLLAISSQGAAEVVDRFRSAVVATVESVGTTAVQLAATPLTERKRMRVMNNSKRTIYVGGANTVTAANGYPVFPGDEQIIEAGAAVEVWAIGEVAAQEVRVFQGA